MVGCDLVVKRVGGKKGNKRLCLITDAESPLRESDKGTIAEQVDLIAEKMGHDGIKLEAVVVRIGQGKYISNSTPCYENESYLERFKSHAKAEVVIAQTATSMLGAIRSRTVAPTTLFRGDLELTPSMSVKVVFLYICILLDIIVQDCESSLMPSLKLLHRQVELFVGTCRNSSILPRKRLPLHYPHFP